MLDFQYIGASRAGSTWLYEQLKKHPEITFPAGKKEVRYWNQDILKNFRPERSQFYNVSEKYYDDLFLGDIKGLKKGDMSDGLSWIDDSVVKKFYQKHKNTKILYCIRNPITTAWSHAKITINKNSKFEDYVNQFKSPFFYPNTKYIENITKWSKMYGKNLLIFTFDELKNKPKKVLKTISEHIEIDSNYWSDVELTKAVNQSHDEKMNEEILSHLNVMYSLEIQKLESLLKRNLNHWKRGIE